MPCTLAKTLIQYVANRLFSSKLQYEPATGWLISLISLISLLLAYHHLSVVRCLCLVERFVCVLLVTLSEQETESDAGAVKNGTSVSFCIIPSRAVLIHVHEWLTFGKEQTLTVAISYPPTSRSQAS